PDNGTPDDGDTGNGGDNGTGSPDNGTPDEGDTGNGSDNGTGDPDDNQDGDDGEEDEEGDDGDEGDDLDLAIAETGFADSFETYTGEAASAVLTELSSFWDDFTSTLATTMATSTSTAPTSTEAPEATPTDTEEEAEEEECSWFPVHTAGTELMCVDAVDIPPEAANAVGGNGNCGWAWDPEKEELVDFACEG
ncbi:hypothetical protein BJY04DRAFT_214791, partial [Aspergillus karnatakaensis]|uniref:uncharacterized protein n=1 Tax=Aspergillus karnatakaensis TaxID=1810916 RepID=UPI003CCE4198